MMTQMKKKLSCLVLLLCVLLNACNNHAERKCDLLLKKAQDNLYQFYTSNDTSLLLCAKEYLDSIDCGSFKNKISYIKTSVLILLGKYSKVIEYVQNLSSASFNKPYHKNMYLKYFEAMQCEAKGDTINSIRLYKEAASEAYPYLDKYRNREILMDLYLIKSKFEQKDKIIQEVDSLKTTGKYDNDFLDGLISTIKSDMENEYSDE
jgi:hypothetical protein